MSENRLDFNKYRDRLKMAYPKYSDEELEKMFVYKVKYWEIMVDNVECIY